MDVMSRVFMLDRIDTHALLSGRMKIRVRLQKGAVETFAHL